MVGEVITLGRKGALIAATPTQNGGSFLGRTKRGLGKEVIERIMHRFVLFFLSIPSVSIP